MKSTAKIAFLFLLTHSIFGQGNEKIVIIGDKLVGKTVNGENFREVIGNVVMTQEDVRITCNKAIQNLSKNEAELIGNVVATQDTIQIFTERGYYFGNEKYTYSDTTVKLFDGSATLTADEGYYYFDEDRAEFYNNVKLVDSVNTLTSMRLVYYNDADKAVATDNVKIDDKTSSIYADSLIHFRNEDKTRAYSNIAITNTENNVVLYGNKLFDEGKRKYSQITGSPLLVKVDTSESGRIDTLMIKSLKMESYNDSTDRLVATDSVKIIRGNFYSVSDYSVYFRKQDYIFTYKQNQESSQPVMWYENSQLVGDSIHVFLIENELDHIDIKINSFILSQNEKYKKRYDQISGNFIKMNFFQRELKSTFVQGNVLSIYYLFEEKEPNGLLKSSSAEAKILFDSSKVKDVRLYGSVKSEYHPENLIVGKELDFTLPTFRLFTNKPDKNKFKSEIKKRHKNILWQKNYAVKN